MYIEKSRNRTSTRIRIVQKVFVAGAWKKQIVRPAFHYKPEQIQAHVVICMLALTIMRILEQEVRPLGLTVDQAIQEITLAKAAIVLMGNREYVVPPAYTPIQNKILDVTR